MNPRLSRFAPALPILVLVVGLAMLICWRMQLRDDAVAMRVPGTDQTPGTNPKSALNPVSNGSVIKGVGEPGSGPGLWNQFRGPERSGVSSETTSLLHSWMTGGPREIWSIDCGEGYAGAAVHEGRVYLMDYDAENKQNALRCLSTTDGKEIWRYAYPLALKRNHGMTRTMPTVTDKLVVAIDPKCNVVCLDSITGALKWSIDLVREFGATVPQWYAGQCPFIDGNAVILAPGGPEALLLSVDLETGKPLWRTLNPAGWKMTHSSIMPMEFAGRKFYVYCGSGGVAGVSSTNGAVLWSTPDWKISIATIPAPLALKGGKIFLCGGYDSGSLMLHLEETNGALVPKILFRLAPEIFGATQHTPVLFDGHLFGVRPSGQFTCLNFDGTVVWTSPAGESFGLGPFLLADGLFFVMNDTGKLSLIEANSARYHSLGAAQVLKGHESWGPMSLANGHLFVRDFTRLACLDVSSK